MELEEIKIGQRFRNIRSRNEGVVIGIPGFDNEWYKANPWVWVEVLRVGANPYKTAWAVKHLEPHPDKNK